MQAFWMVVLVFVLIYATVCLLAWLIQTIFLFHPEKLQAGFVYRYEHPHEEVFIDVEDGSRINGILFRAPESRGVIFYFKGNTRSVKGWGKFHKDFVPLGFDFFMMDYPGFGKSRGRRDEHAIYNDAQQAYKWLTSLYGEQNIYIYGRSLGSGFAARIASWNRPRMLILDSPFYSFRLLARRYAFYLPLWLILRYQIPLNAFLRTTQCPVFILHGNRDWLIPYHFSQKLVGENQGAVHLFTIDGGHHNDLPKFSQYTKFLKGILTDSALYERSLRRVHQNVRREIH